MTYRVKLTATAQKQRKQMPPQIRARIDAALVGLKTDPRPTGVVKLSGSKNDWRIRVGDYRILYEIDDNEEVITVWRIAHRREAYQT